MFCKYHYCFILYCDFSARCESKGHKPPHPVHQGGEATAKWQWEADTHSEAEVDVEELGLPQTTSHAPSKRDKCKLHILV